MHAPLIGAASAAIDDANGKYEKEALRRAQLAATEEFGPITPRLLSRAAAKAGQSGQWPGGSSGSASGSEVVYLDELTTAAPGESLPDDLISADNQQSLERGP